MPVGKSITECLQGLGVLEKKSEGESRTQWPENAKTLNEAVLEFADSIEEESCAHGAEETLNNWIKERAIEWVQSNSADWSAEGRLPQAPVFPGDEQIIAYWIQQYVLNKWHNASKYRKKKETPSSLPGLQFHGSAAAHNLDDDGLITRVRDVEQVQAPEASSESHDLDGWDPYGDSEHDGSSQNAAGVTTSTSAPILSDTSSRAIVPYEGPELKASYANNDSSQETSSSIPAGNNFRSRTYAPVAFQAEMYSKITFLIGPSQNRNGNNSNSYARIMGLEEAQLAETFRAGVFERLAEMGEVVRSRRLVAKPDWMALSFVVESDHDHHFLLETLKAWGEWKAPLCVVYVSLEHEI